MASITDDERRIRPSNRLNPAKPAAYPQSRATQRKLYGPRAIVSHGPENNPANSTAPPRVNPATFQLGAATQQRNPPSSSVGVANPPKIVYNDERPANPAVARPTKLVGPNVPKGAGDKEIAAALAENKRAVAPGGMGTSSTTQDAQASNAAKGRMDPTNFNFRARNSKGVVTAIEPGDTPASEKRTFQDTAGNTRTAVTIKPEHRVAGGPAEGTGTIKPGGPDQWRRDLHNEHPEIFKEGTVENKEFVEEFKRNNMDPAKAAEIASRQRAERVVGQTRNMPPSAAQTRSEIPPPSTMSGAQVRGDISVAGPAAGPAKPSPAKALGQAIGAVPRKVGEMIGGANEAEGSALRGAVRGVKDFVGGVFNPPEEPRKRRNPAL